MKGSTKGKPLKERALRTLKSLGRGFAFLYKKYGFVKCLIAVFLVIGLSKAVVSEHNYLPSVSSARSEAVKPWNYVRPAKPACGPEVGQYDYHGDCSYTQTVREKRTDISECNVLIADVMGVPVESIKATGNTYMSGGGYDGKGGMRYFFTRNGDNGQQWKYTCMSNIGDLMVQWVVHTPGMSDTVSKWHNLNTESL